MCQAGLWPSLSVYAHCPCSGISALLNMGIRDM